MILEPLINNSMQFEMVSKENKSGPEKKIERPITKKNERIFEKKKIDIPSKKEKVGFKINVYICVLIIFLIGIITGSMVFRLLIEDTVIKEMVIEKFSVLENKEFVENEILKESLSRNIKMLSVFWIVGISIVGAPLLILLCFYKGFTTAFVISSFLVKFGFLEGNRYVFGKLFVYYIFVIFAIILLTTSSIKVMINVLKHKKDIRLEFIRHSVFTILGLILMMISTFFEIKFL